MATQERTWNVANRLHSQKDSDTPAVNHIIAGADEIYDDDKQLKQSEHNAQTDAALSDRYTKDETYNREQLNELITTPDVEYVTVAAYADLPVTGSPDTIYRVSQYDGTQVDPTKYALYAWDGNTYVLLAVRTSVGEVFDISDYHEGTMYSSLSDALGVNGANVPQTLRKGGMTIKYIQSSDNKYVQCRYMGTSTAVADFTNTANWQGVDDEPTAGSGNLMTSGGVYNAIATKSEMPLVDEDGFHVTDENLNIGMKYDEDGLDAAKVSSHFIEVLKASGVNADDVVSSHASEVEEDGFFFVDESLNIGVKIDSDGIHAKNIIDYEIIEN